MIIVEGPDGVGKSTLCRALADLHESRTGESAIMLHAGPPKVHPLLEYVAPLQKHSPSEMVICDRWHLGELIYGPILRGETKMTPAITWYVENYLARRGAVVCVLTTSDEVLISRYHERPQLPTLDQLLDVADAYRSYVEEVDKKPPQHVFSELSVGDGSTLDDGVLNLLLEVSYVASACIDGPLDAFSSYIGSDGPEYLLVGDKQSTRARGLTGAFAPWADSCGETLINAILSLEHLSPSPTFGMVNANDSDDPGSILELLDFLDPTPKVIALGELASNALTQIGVAHEKIWHPQFVNRFHHKTRVAKVANQLYDAMERLES